ncbi:hypothetical protein TMEN_4396 [Trichophyton mentagrophytes]|uniref:Uncharacterized protein n=1 Tax=Trichophyton interdigitale (strain MR816) TaxID=1215338 RepID=A0A059JHG7_TRIIM|nr:hypothetical protein H109_01073 [Trichophyton interdigitale MR816]GBF61878.1 hypothetical protein TMEN_4396 [Trichophyton mentagrophytes]
MEDASGYLTGLSACIVCAMAPRYISPPCLRGSPGRNGSTIQPLSMEAVLPYLFPKGATLNISETLEKGIIEVLRDQLWVLLANVTQLF